MLVARAVTPLPGGVLAAWAPASLDGAALSTGCAANRRSSTYTLGWLLIQVHIRSSTAAGTTMERRDGLSTCAAR